MTSGESFNDSHKMPSPPLYVSCTERRLLLPNIVHYLGTDWKRNSDANTILIIAFPSSTNMLASGQLNLATGLIFNRNTYGSVSAGREKWPFNVLFFFKSRASV